MCLPVRYTSLLENAHIYSTILVTFTTVVLVTFSSETGKTSNGYTGVSLKKRLFLDVLGAAMILSGFFVLYHENAQIF